MEKIKVLLVDDHIVVREGIKELIQAEKDMEVVGEASNGEESIKAAGELAPDVIIMDIAMPGMNGIEATKQIKTLYPTTAILILTAYDNEEFIFAIIQAKAAGYMLKNARGDEVLNAIRAVYAGDSVLHPSITKKVLSHMQPARDPSAAKPDRTLSVRELQIVTLGARGLVNKEIAEQLALSDRTVQTHWRNIFVKIGVSSRVEAIMYCLKREWINV